MEFLTLVPMEFHGVPNLLFQLVDIELNEISSQYEECLEAYNSAHSTNPQIHSSFIVSDSSSFISSSYSRSPRSASSLRSNSSTITPTNRPLSRQRVPPDIGLGPRQSTDISGYLFREGSRLRNFAETTRNFSRGSFVESRQYSKQVVQLDSLDFVRVAEQGSKIIFSATAC